MGNSTQRPVTRSFDIFFDLDLNKRLSKQSWGWWLEAPSSSIWRYCNGLNLIHVYKRAPEEIFLSCIAVGLIILTHLWHLNIEIIYLLCRCRKMKIFIILFHISRESSLTYCWNTFEHDDVIKWKHIPRNWPFVRGIHRSRWILHTKASDAELWCFLLSASE